MLVALLAAFGSLSPVAAQVGEYRTDLAIGPNIGYTMSSVAFVPTVPQTQLKAMTGGLTVRYTCEKYFSSICAVVAEVNYAQIGWQERILDYNDNPVPLHTDETQTLHYARKMTYVQVPFFARLGWGRERRGVQFFFQIGPQFGVFVNDKAETNFDVRQPEFNPGPSEEPNPLYKYRSARISHVVAQDTMAVEKKFDYGIVFGGGLEFSHRKLGHFIVEGRYYYGLGNVFKNSKSDYFGKSNYGQIIIKATCLFDIVRTRNPKIK